MPVNAYADFIKRLALFSSKRKDILAMVLQNIFSMRRIGNKTHGDLAEVAISEFINQYMYDFSSKHVGKDMFRAKEHEEDILVKNEITDEQIPISLKAYGVGPLQLSTDKSSLLFNRLKDEGDLIDDTHRIQTLFSDSCFEEVRKLHIMPLIYNEKSRICNVLFFNVDAALSSTSVIRFISRGERGRKHPIYRFETKDGDYICEVRYGGASANALQRGLWTHTKHAASFFTPLSNEWVHYEDNEALLDLIAKAMVASQYGHEQALKPVISDIERIKSEK